MGREPRKHRAEQGCPRSPSSALCTVPNCLSACHLVTSRLRPSELCPHLTLASGNSGKSSLGPNPNSPYQRRTRKEQCVSLGQRTNQATSDPDTQHGPEAPCHRSPCPWGTPSLMEKMNSLPGHGKTSTEERWGWHEAAESREMDVKPSPDTDFLIDLTPWVSVSSSIK